MVVGKGFDSLSRIMKHKWKNKFEFDVGAAMPLDAAPMPKSGRKKYLRCPLCFESCSDGYWNTYHSKQIHLQCPLCLQWYAKAQGLSMHLTRSQCGFEILRATDQLMEAPKREFVIKII